VPQPIPGQSIPYAHIDTVFLDVGNTLISIDFDWVAAELRARGFNCAADELRRAEAAARPGYSQRLFVEKLYEGQDLFLAYLNAILGKHAITGCLPSDQLDALLKELRPVLRPDGRASALWKMVMPRIPESLTRLRDLGLTLVVVSNSDGTVERSLDAAGLRSYFSVVIDSAIVGFEKPDPRIFLRALELSGAKPDRTLHVGDIYHADVIGARGAGLHAVLLDPHEDWPANALDCERVPDVWAVAERLTAERQPAQSSR
jgi:HAD superfamily hydrolase (TIGR01509 family)